MNDEIQVGSRVEYPDGLAENGDPPIVGTVTEMLPPITIGSRVIPTNRAFIIPDDGKTLGGIRHVRDLQVIGLNKWLHPDKVEPFAELPDGTDLYPAYDPLGPGDTFRRGLSGTNGSGGLLVGVTPAGQLYRQQMRWGNSEPVPEKWEKVNYDAGEKRWADYSR